MKVAIIQLSDIHLKSEKDFVITHQEEFYRSCKHIINECSNLIIVITGDIAFKGAKEEYDLATRWLNNCVQSWKREARFLNKIDYVIVPGNHDCDFSESQTIRETIKQSILNKDLLEEKELADLCLSIQNNFWNFYGDLTGVDMTPQISISKTIQLKLDYSIRFDCYNSAFLSSIDEKPGELIIPENYFLKPLEHNSDQVVISLFHHNTGWLSPNTTNNNKKRFEEHIYNCSNIIMCGHEHYNQNNIISNLNDYQELIYLESSAFQQAKNSEYSLLLLDTDNDIITQYKYRFEDDCYCEQENNIFQISRRQNGITLNPEWIDKLDEISMPLKHSRKERLCLSDIFTYPDLEPLSEFDSKYTQYIDSEDILNQDNTESITILEGDNQSGKSSLLQMLFSSSYKRGYFPLLINGKDIKNLNIRDLLKKEYKRQYLYKNYSLDKYLQLDSNKRILFIDDYDKSILNPDSKSKLLENLLCNFNRIIITNNHEVDIKNILVPININDNVKRYRILSLGYHKRNILIEKWLRLGHDSITIDENIIFEQIKQTYDKITALLGQQLIPSYPIFILSLLQGLNQALTRFDVSQTSYAYCYNSLIIASLIKTGTEEDKINGVLKFLSELSYHLYTNYEHLKYYTKANYLNFYNIYSKEYNVPYGSEKLFENLAKANLLRLVDDECFEFAYRYVFYYLVAQKISQLVNNNEADGIVQKLCSNLHKEREANILIFLVYHNGTEKQMEDLLFASWLPFENYSPITLQNDDPLFNDLNAIVENIQSKVLLNVDPKENRENALKKSDEIQKSCSQETLPTEQEFESNKDLKDLNNTIKIIKILGQIVKNQKESLKKEQILKLLEESYNVCFRSIAFFNKMIDDSKDDIVTYIIEQNDPQKLNDESIRNKVQKMLQMFLYHHCLMSFANLSRSVGTSDMPEIYDEVAKKFNTPAAKIITFTIKTYYNKMHLNDLEELIHEFRNNPVATEIIKARVLNYVYNNYIDASNRQRIGELCNLKLVDNGAVYNRRIAQKKL